MEAMTLKQVQEFSLQILKDIHNFCVDDDIKYSLAYGTLLGAIRHQGFIPWDDDIDIMLPRSDFEKFCREYHSEKFIIVSPESNDGYIPYARVCDMKKTRVISKGPWCKMETGIWVDVFPIDGLPSSICEFDDEVKAIKRLGKLEGRLRTGKLFHNYKILDTKQVLICGLKKLLYHHYNIRSILTKHIDILKSHDFNTSDYCGQLCCVDNPEKEHNPKSDFSGYCKKQFEDDYFFVIDGYDNVLSRYYGDYRQLPPPEAQHPDGYNKYSWL